jgi:hypothetical protein
MILRKVCVALAAIGVVTASAAYDERQKELGLR